MDPEARRQRRAERRAARKEKRATRSGCVHVWVLRKRSGVERCSLCDDQFPCRKNCWHVDCWVRRLNLGIVEHYPLEWAFPSMRISDGKGGFVYDTFDDDPAEWTLPTAATTIEDVT